MHRRTQLTALLLVLAAAGVALWWTLGSSGDAPGRVVSRDAPSPSGETHAVLVGTGQDGPATPPAALSTAEDAETPGWFLVGDVQTLDPKVRTARVEAWWWAEKPADDEAEPTEVFTTEDLDLSSLSADFRLDGRGAGWVQVFLIGPDGRQAFLPFDADPWRQVTPGRGLGINTGYVGTQTLAGRTIDVEGHAVPGVSLYIMDSAKPGWPRRTRSDAEGRFRLGGFHSPNLEVTVDEERVRGGVPEFAGFQKRPVRLTGNDDVTLVLHRYPLVHVLGRVDAFGAEGVVAANLVRPSQAQADGSFHSAEERWWYDLQQGMRLRPGRWRLQASFHYLGTHMADTPDLALDTSTTVEIPLPVEADQPLLLIRLPAPTTSIDDVVQVAAAAKRLPGADSWSGSQAAGPGATLLMPLSPDRWTIYGAVRVNGAVSFSADVEIELAEGERRTLDLPVEPAAGLVLPPTPRRHDGRAWVHLVTRDFPGPGVVQGEPFQTFHFGGRSRTTMWWLPAGPHVIERWGANDKPFERLELVLEPGEVVTLEEGPHGLRVADEGGD